MAGRKPIPGLQRINITLTAAELRKLDRIPGRDRSGKIRILIQEATVDTSISIRSNASELAANNVCPLLAADLRKAESSYAVALNNP